MARTTKEEDVIQNIKDCGLALVANAEKIANNYKYRCGLMITCYIESTSETPYISVSTDFIPESYIERKTN